MIQPWRVNSISGPKLELVCVLGCGHSWVMLIPTNEIVVTVLSSDFVFISGKGLLKLNSEWFLSYLRPLPPFIHLFIYSVLLSPLSCIPSISHLTWNNNEKYRLCYILQSDTLEVLLKAACSMYMMWISYCQDSCPTFLDALLNTSVNASISAPSSFLDSLLDPLHAVAIHTYHYDACVMSTRTNIGNMLEIQ